MTNEHPPQEFANALRSLRGVAVPPNVAYREVPAPNRLAPYAAAIGFEIPAGANHPSCTATLVILYDPEHEHTWGGPIRLVGQARTAIDQDMSGDPLLGEVLWSSLRESLTLWAGDVDLLMGTVTREITETFGGLELRSSALNAEIRCSWTPAADSDDPDLSGNLLAWANFLEQIAAVPQEHEHGLEVHNG